MIQLLVYSWPYKLHTMTTSNNVRYLCPLESHHEDLECEMLKEVMMQVFSNDSITNTTEQKVYQFSWVYSLVFRVSHKLGIAAVQSIWLQCCQTVLGCWAKSMSIDHYADHKLNENNVSLLQNLLRYWTRYQAALNMGHSLMVYTQSRSSKCQSTISCSSDTKQVFYDIFVEHFLNNSNLRGRVFEAIVTTMNIRNQSQEFEQNNLKEQNVKTVQSVLKLLRQLDHHSEIVFYRLFAFPYLKLLQSSTIGHQQPDLFSLEEVVAYLKEVESVIEHYVFEANIYCFPSTLVRMVGKFLYSHLIDQHCEQICRFSIFARMVQVKCLDKLDYVFRVISYHSDGVKLMATNVQRYLHAELNSIVRLKQNEPNNSEQICFFIKSLIELYHYWTKHMVTQVFALNLTIRQAITDTFAKYLNSEPVHVCILAVFVHLASLSQASFDVINSRQVVLNQVGCLLSLLEDKPLLAEYLHFFLCDRTVRGVSFELEEDFVLTSRLIHSLKVESSFNAKLILKEYRTNKITLDIDRKLNPNLPMFEVSITLFIVTLCVFHHLHVNRCVL